MNLILEKGHSRVPVYYEQPTNIIGLVLVTPSLMHYFHNLTRFSVKSFFTNIFLFSVMVPLLTIHIYYLQVKNLLTINPDEEIPVKNVTIRRIPR